MDEYVGSFFEQIVRDAVKEIQSGGQGYCFSLAQVEAVKKKLPLIEVREVEGIYYLKGDCTREKKYKKKDNKPSHCSN